MPERAGKGCIYKQLWYLNQKKCPQTPPLPVWKPFRMEKHWVSVLCLSNGETVTPASQALDSNIITASGLSSWFPKTVIWRKDSNTSECLRVCVQSCECTDMHTGRQTCARMHSVYTVMHTCRCGCVQRVMHTGMQAGVHRCVCTCVCTFVHTEM